MEFRLCREDEYLAVRQLWGQCFGEEEPWTSWYFSMHYQAGKTWVGVESGCVLAQAHLLPHRLWLRGAWREAVYIVGVCVDEKRRGEGLGREILATALEELRRKGTGITILQPRWPVFYRKLGWDYCYSRTAYRLPLDEAEPQLPAQLPELAWLPDTQEKAPLAALYDSFVQSRHAYAQRRGLDWEKLLADHFGAGGRAGLFLWEGIPCGYALYSSIEACLHVRELVWVGNASPELFWKPLIGAARLLGDDRVEWLDPSEESGLLLSPAAPSEPFLMGRLIDVASALGAIDYPAELSVEMNVKVTDTLSPWNSGLFHWSIRDGKGRLSPAESGEEPGLVLGIGTLSQLVFGQHSARRLLSAGNGNGCREEDIELLERIFPECRNFISEFF